MNLKHFGGGCIALGILLFLVALGLPATVADTSTTCIDTWSYGQECSTVQYERPNYARTQLFGAGIFSTFLGLFVYGVGATRSGGSTSWSTSGPARPPGGPERPSDGPDNGAGGTRGDATTLRAQLEARTDADAGATSSETATSAPVGSEPAAAAAEGRAESSADRRRLGAAAGVAVSGLASAFALTWMVDLIATVESVVVRTLAFATFALPGVVLYSRYRTDEPTDGGPDEGEAVR